MRYFYALVLLFLAGTANAQVPDLPVSQPDSLTLEWYYLDCRPATCYSVTQDSVTLLYHVSWDCPDYTEVCDTVRMQKEMPDPVERAKWVVALRRDARTKGLKEGGQEPKIRIKD